MSKKLLFFLLTCTYTAASTQPWNYAFGSAAAASHSSGSSTNFLPDAPAGSDRVRVGGGGGSFILQNPGLASLGSGTELKISAPTSASVNKFSISGYTPSSVFSISFNVLFGNGNGSTMVTSGDWSFFQGAGASYSDNNNFTSAQVFAGLRFQYSMTGITLNYRSGSSWVTTGLFASNLEQGVVYSIEIYGNNSAMTQTYNGGSQSLAAYRFDLWINGTKFGDDLLKGELPNGTSIDSWMFYGESSTSNAAHIFLDDFIYSNTLSALLPIELTKFDVNLKSNFSYLTWSTATELNNALFQIERSADGRSFETIGEVEGAGTSYETLHYAFTDEKPLPDWNYYRLKQVDFDGQFAYSPVRAVLMDPTNQVNDRLDFSPNPAGNEIFIQSQTNILPGDQLEVFDQFGRLILQLQAANALDSPVDISTLPAGVYVARLKTADGFAVGTFLVKR